MHWLFGLRNLTYIPKGNTAEGDEKVGVQGHTEWGVKEHGDEDVGVGGGENVEKNMVKPSYREAP